MPLPPLAPSSTPRFFIDYTSMEIPHTVMFRTDGLPGDSGSFFGGIIDSMLAVMRQADQVTQVRFAAQGSDVTYPLFVVGNNGLLSNASAISDDPEAVFISCPFRGIPSGRKGRYDFFFPTNAIPLDANNRFPFASVTELGPLESAIASLVDTGIGGVHLVDISGGRILLNQYWNRAKSAYWQRRQRRG